MGRPRKYFTEEEKKAAQREYERRYREIHKDKIAAKNAGYYQRNKDKIAKYQAEWYQNNKDKIAAKKSEYRKNNKDKFAKYMTEYRLTPFGRANSLVNGYRRNDKKHNRGECTLTPDWIVDNIFSQPCHYCGKTDWHELGCDRIDNNLPHTPNNVVPCCWECNNKKQKIPYDEFMRMIGKIKSGGSPTS